MLSSVIYRSLCVFMICLFLLFSTPLLFYFSFFFQLRSLLSFLPFVSFIAFFSLFLLRCFYSLFASTAISPFPSCLNIIHDRLCFTFSSTGLGPHCYCDLFFPDEPGTVLGTTYTEYRIVSRTMISTGCHCRCHCHPRPSCIVWSLVWSGLYVSGLVGR